MEFHHHLAKVHNIEVYYSTTAKEIRTDPVTGAFASLLASQDDTSLVIEGKAIVLAAGGFEANSQMRSEHMGSEWSLAHVRGTPYNTGDVLILAIRGLSARTAGQWSGCHSVAWDANAPIDTGDRDISNEFTKSGYPLGITLNLNGERFFDEGADLRNYTYAKFGRAILRQPKGMAFQVWDQKGIPWLRSEEYREERVERIWGLTIAELASKCVTKGLENPSTFIQTIKDYNVAAYAHHSANPDLKFDPAVLDSLSTQSSSTSLKIPKSNWALPIDNGPFMAVKVACGITFTFGGLAVDPETTGVISDLTGECIPGVFCAGEMLGGLFWDNYPGGSGLTAGVVFGRIAGREAAEVARRSEKTRDGDGAQELGSRE
jgi:succinate dehydrogenase/fumarate reductase flavoprotein subunit